MRSLPNLLLLSVAGFLLAETARADDPSNRIRPFVENPAYWQYKGEPVVLIGGSDDDNLFQWDESKLREQLDILKSLGGNYIRNTMSSRDEGNIWPFERNPEGKYDLERPSEAYGQKFETLLKLAKERDIIVQIELWDRFDFAREPWEVNPYNPSNNINYSVAESSLETRYPNHPGRNDNRFFFSVPELDHNETVLKYQEAQVDRLLSISLEYPNVLYCMDNETSGQAEWGAYWADRLRKEAQKQGVEIQTTEMWDPWDLSHPMHRFTFDNPDRYTFVDVSQNNHQKGRTHWTNMQVQRARIADRPRPINNVKIYGADTGRYGTDRDAIERLWRNLIGGMASARFHRPDAGLGLGEKARPQIQSARMLADSFDFFQAQPDADGDLLSQATEAGAYLTSIPGEQYAILLLNGGKVNLDLSKVTGKFATRWLKTDQASWTVAEPVEGGKRITLEAPQEGVWVALLSRTDNPGQ